MISFRKLTSRRSHNRNRILYYYQHIGIICCIFILNHILPLSISIYFSLPCGHNWSGLTSGERKKKFYIANNNKDYLQYDYDIT